MKKNVLFGLLFGLVAGGVAQNVSLEPAVKTFAKAGAGASVVVKATGQWTAKSSDDWIDIKLGASGSGNGKVVYIVDRNTTADTREGTITVGDATHRIVQRGQVGNLSPQSMNYDHAGGSGTVKITLNAGVQWTATSNNGWIHVTSNASGMSNGSIDYLVDAYNGVESRSGSLTIAGATFSITQSGRDVVLTPAVIEKEQGADIVLFTVSSLDRTNWTVQPLDAWIEVLDEGPKFGDGNVTLSISSNPSFLLREGRVQVNDAVLLIRQKGVDEPSYSINPETVDAPGNGSFGLVTVSATPDAPWDAEAKEPWITITENARGAGNANIKYVVSANPLPEPRSGSIIVTPNNKRQVDDYARGLLLHMVNYENFGFDMSGFSSPQSETHSHKDNAFFFDNGNKLEWGKDLFKLPTEKSFTISGLFHPYYNERVNSFLELQAGDSLFSLTSSEDGVLQLSVDGKRHDSSFSLLRRQWQVFILRYHQDTMKVYAGMRGELAKEVLSVDLKSQVVGRLQAGPQRLTLGAITSPTGYFTGLAEDFRFYGRALSDSEIKGYDASVQNTLKPFWVGPDYELYTYRKDGVNNADAHALVLEGEHLPRPLTRSIAHFVHNILDVNLSKWLDRTTISNSNITMGGTVLFENRNTNVIDPNWTHWNYEYDWGWVITRQPQLVAVSGHRWIFKDKDSKAGVFVVGKELPEGVELGSGLVQKHYYKGSNSYILNRNGAKIGMNKHSAQNVLPDKGLDGFDYGSLNLVGDQSRVIHDKTNAFGSPDKCTLSFWVKFNSLQHGRVISTWTEAGDNQADRFVALDLVDSQQFQISFQHLHGWNATYDIVKNIVKDEWSLITLTESLSGTVHNFRVYLNDRFIFEKDIDHETTLFLLNDQNNSNLVLGHRGIWNHGGQANPDLRSARMSVAELSIYDKVLTKPEIEKLYRSKKGPVLVHRVNQKASLGSLSKSEIAMPPAGGSDFVDVEVSNKTNWKAESQQSWIKPINSATRSGNGRVDYVVDPNDSVYPRIGTLDVAGNSLVIRQEGYKASLEANSSQFGPDGGDFRLKVTTEASAIWNAVSDSDWVSIVEPTGGRGKGPGTVFFIVDAYSSPVRQRQATLTIAGVEHVVTQAGYELSVEPLVAEVEGNSGALTLTVTAPLGVVWEAITTTPWITIVGDQERMGSGRLDYVITQNETGEVRTGTIIIGGKEIRVVQKASARKNNQATASAQVVNGFIVGVKVINGGSGYHSKPNVSIVSSKGSGVKMEVVLSDGKVAEIKVLNPGFGYDSDSAVRIDPPSSKSNRASGQAEVINGFVVGLSVVDGGSGYSYPPKVQIVGGGGSGAGAVAVVQDGKVVDLILASAGSGYTSLPEVVINPPQPFLTVEATADGKRVKIGATAAGGVRCRLEGSDDLRQWIAISDDFVADGDTVSFEFEAGAAKRFYRFVWLQ